MGGNNDHLEVVGVLDGSTWIVVIPFTAIVVTKTKVILNDAAIVGWLWLPSIGA